MTRAREPGDEGRIATNDRLRELANRPIRGTGMASVAEPIPAGVLHRG